MRFTIALCTGGFLLMAGHATAGDSTDTFTTINQSEEPVALSLPQDEQERTTGTLEQAIPQADPWIGTWSDGKLTVTFQDEGGKYSGSAHVQGVSYPLTGNDTARGLAGAYTHAGQAYPWQAELQGDTMIFHVDGITTHMRKRASAQPGAAGQQDTQEAGQLSAEAREWHQWLAGKRLTQMSSYYSGPDFAGGAGGGTSSRNVWDLCSDGTFYYSGYSQVGVGGSGVNGLAGGSEGGAGRWRIIQKGQLIGLELRWHNGTVSEHLLQYSEDCTYIDGTRTFVTSDNASCR